MNTLHVEYLHVQQLFVRYGHMVIVDEDAVQRSETRLGQKWPGQKSPGSTMAMEIFKMAIFKMHIFIQRGTSFTF
jgi:hypothetical protein